MEKTLLVLAGGLGSRFGGLKQVAPVGPNGEVLLDYSIYDAIKAGFTNVVFVIKEENEVIFKSTIGDKISKIVPVSYVYQGSTGMPFSREKPWGTAHAIYVTAKTITNNFAIINADNFYGYDALLKASEFLDNTSNQEFGIVGYKLENTLSCDGDVKRGIINAKDNYVTGITESLIKKGDKLTAFKLNTEDEVKIDDNTKVSVNLMCFTPFIFKLLEENKNIFINENKDNLSSAEWLIPSVIDYYLNNKTISLKLIPTDSKMYELTFKDDVYLVREKIQELVDNNIYPKKL